VYRSADQQPVIDIARVVSSSYTELSVDAADPLSLSLSFSSLSELLVAEDVCLSHLVNWRIDKLAGI
jgi:hypothetical protein